MWAEFVRHILDPSLGGVLTGFMHHRNRSSMAGYGRQPFGWTSSRALARFPS